MRAVKRDPELAQIGFDLHDGPLQSVSFLVGHLHALRDDLEDGEPPDRLLPAVDELVDVSIDLERGLRTLASTLVSGLGASKPFDLALADTIARFSRRSGLRPDVELAGPIASVAPPVADALVYAVGEALENVRKHSHAHDVRILASVDAPHVEVLVADDGIGFDPAQPSDGLGLVGMRARLRRCGGRCAIVSSPGRGTTVRLLV